MDNKLQHYGVLGMKWGKVMSRGLQKEERRKRSLKNIRIPQKFTLASIKSTPAKNISAEQKETGRKTTNTIMSNHGQTPVKDLPMMPVTPIFSDLDDRRIRG